MRHLNLIGNTADILACYTKVIGQITIITASNVGLERSREQAASKTRPAKGAPFSNERSQEMR